MQDFLNSIKLYKSFKIIKSYHGTSGSEYKQRLQFSETIYLNKCIYYKNVHMYIHSQWPLYNPYAV